LSARGVDLVVPEVSFAHPLDDGGAVLAWRDLARMGDELGTTAWSDTFARLVTRADDVVSLALGDHRSWPLDSLGTGARPDRLAPGAVVGAGAALARGFARGLLAGTWGPRADALFS